MDRNPAILIVDDAKENVAILEKLLQSEKFQVFKSYSAKEARSILLSQEIDTILLDVNMPEQDGYSFCKELREIDRFKLLPIIFITAVDRDTGFQEAIRNGGDDFISKPFNKKELIAKIHAFLRIKKLQDELLEQKIRYEKELKAARKAQEQFIPPKSIQWGNVKAFTFFQPLFQVGGDFTDIWIEDESLHAVIADCSGHGPSAALVGIAFKMQLMRVIRTDSLPNRIEKLRLNLKGILPEDVFITFIYVILYSDGTLEYIKCAHPEPLIYQNGNVSTLPGLSPMISEIDFQTKDTICKSKLEKGSVLLLYTDGLIESTNKDLEMLGLNRLSEYFKGCVESGAKDENIFLCLMNKMYEFCDGKTPEDDVAMVCIIT